MPVLLLLCLTRQSFALTNSTVLEGWQFDDNSRSSWDILWTCVSTILACTWTALHMRVPQGPFSSATWKSLAWTSALLAPELMAFKAVQELWEVKLLVARCNSAQTATDGESEDPNVLSPKLAESSAGSSVSLSSPPWTYSQGFCIRMHGLVLQTRDDWVYVVRPANAVALMQQGVVTQPKLRDSDIKDRAKADSFAKAFTLLQSSWVVCNIIARAAYSLPITAIEISTVAYVVCAVVAYTAWWHKPKDMNTPIAIYLPYDRDSDEMTPAVRNILDEHEDLWIRLTPGHSNTAKVSGLELTWYVFVEIVKGPVKLWNAFKKMPERDSNERSQQPETPARLSGGDEKARSPSPDPNSIGETASDLQPAEILDESLTVIEQFSLDVLSFLAALIFCGIHIAA